MSAMAPGARTWSARSTTVTRTGCLAAALLAGVPAAAGDALDRILHATATASGATLPPRSALIEACGSDLPCSGRFLVDVLGAAARLVPVAHPDTDTIRWVETRPSLRLEREDGALRIELLSFGRKIMPELAAALGAVDGEPSYVLDLRQAQGGRFARMLEVAGFFLGPRQQALALVGADGTTWVDLPGPAARGPRLAAVRIGAATASAGEVLAALLVAHGGAALCGSEPSAGAAALKAVIPVDHDWRLLVERARIEVPAVDLDDGLRPSRAC
jgi:Peptidase family S41